MVRLASPALGGWLRRRAIVTGGASGFGEATVRWMVSRGANVIIADINEERGVNVAKEISAEETEGSARFVKTDVTKAGSWSSLVKTTLDELGGLDVLVNNAGGTYTNKPTLEVTEADFDKCINLNMRSIFRSVGAVVPHFLSQKQGVIVNDASKGAVNVATKSLAIEYAASGIRVNAVCPVIGNTPLLKSFLGKNSKESFVASVPMGRLSEPEEVASAVAWLASEEAKFVTGVCLEVDGGRCI